MSEPTPAIARRRPAAPAPAPQLFEVLDCANPLRPPARHSLAGIDEVEFVRGEERSAVREGRTLRLAIPDRFMSSKHARLVREADRFRLEDSRSKNGTFVNGAAEHERLLADGDAIELGRTQLLFRAAMPDGPDAIDAPPGLATLVPPLAAELRKLPAIARSGEPVVISAETGAGKELIAQALHQLSARRGPFVAVNCGAIAHDLVVSELFGVRKGAFTGAGESRPGLVRAADGGTLFLDEIGDLAPDAQAALLRVLQESEVLAVGATEPSRVDVRVLAATHVDLEGAVAAGQFRADLFARICGFTVKLPPLRWRREDLGLLIAAILRKHRAPQATFTCEAGRALLAHRWPMNIRELEKAVASAAVLAGDGPIDVQHLPAALRKELTLVPARPLSPEDARRREELVTVLQAHRGNVAAAARVLGKARMQLHRWARRYDLRLSDFR